MNKEKLYEDVMNKWGQDAIMAKTIEECGELISVLAKHHLNDRVYSFNFNKIVDEIADVTIMMEQMRIVYGEKTVDARIQKKLARLQKLIGIPDDLCTCRIDACEPAHDCPIHRGA